MANQFNAAKMIGAKDPMFEIKYNMLIDLIDERLKVLSVLISDGISVNKGVLTIAVASAASNGLLSKADWVTFNGKQDHDDELDSLSLLEDANGMMHKTADATYELIKATAVSDFILGTAAGSWIKKTLAEVQTILGISGLTSDLNLALDEIVNGVPGGIEDALALIVDGT